MRLAEQGGVCFQNTIAPRISLSGARACYVGPGLDLAPHRNAAATIAMAIDEPFALWIAADAVCSPAVRRQVAVIAPGTRHHLVASGPMLFVYLDALADDYSALHIDQLERAQQRLAAERTLLDHYSVDAVCAMIGITARTAADSRIAAVVRYLDRAPIVFSARDGAAMAAMSVSRFQTLFRAATGVPFRRYRLWRRLAAAVRAAAAGETLTNAAIDAGLASSAHLSTSFKAMFGMTPSALLAMPVQFDFGDVLR